MQSPHDMQTIGDDELLRRLVELLRHSRGTEADLVAHVGEVDARRLYAREASPSMFAYCTEVLHLSEAEAYLRIAVARASREHPVLLQMLADGRLHLSAIAKLASKLTPENREDLLRRASHKSKRQVEELLAGLDPRPDVAASMRKLPECRVGTLLSSDPRLPSRPELRLDEVVPSGMDGLVTSALERHPDAVAAPRAAVIEPLAPARYKVQFTASAALRDKLERLRDLMRSSVPDGDLAAIVEQAVTEKLERLESRRFGRTRARKTVVGDHDVSSPSSPPSTRHVPAAVRRAVYERDGGRCRYVDAQGRRCTARERLEFHHRHPFGLGGEHSVDSISLVCRAHNGYLAEIDYGRKAIARHRRRRQGVLDLTQAPP